MSPTKVILTTPDGATFTIEGVPGDSGTIESDQHVEEVDEGDDLFNAAVDGIEGFLLAMFCQGMSLQTPAILSAIDAALQGASNAY